MTKPGFCSFMFDLAGTSFCVCFTVFQVHVFFFVSLFLVVNTSAISQLPNLFISTPGICNFILCWVRSFSKMLLSVKFAEDICSFSLFSVKKC